MIRIIRLTGFFISLAVSLSAQWVLPEPTAESTDLARIKAMYSQEGLLSYAMTYRLFAPNETVAKDSLKGSLTLSGHDYHAKIATLEYLKEGNRLLYIDHDAQQIVVLPLSKNASNPLEAGTLAGVLESENIAAEVQNLGGNRRLMTLEMPQSGVAKMDVWYSTDNYFIERTRTVLAANEAVIDVQYTQIKRQKGKLARSITYYAVLKNKKYTPTERFKNYKITVRT